MPPKVRLQPPAPLEPLDTEELEREREEEERRRREERYRNIFPKYKGDIFSSMASEPTGLLYQSRMPKAMLRYHKKKEDLLLGDYARPKTAPGARRNRRESTAMPEDTPSAASAKAEAEAAAAKMARETASLDAARRRRKMRFEAQRVCSGALLELASQDDDAAVRLVEEGGVEQLLGLAHVPDFTTRRSVLCALYQLSLKPCVREAMLHRGVVRALTGFASGQSGAGAETGPAGEQRLLMQGVAGTLCNISLQPGSEPRLVQDGAVTIVLDLSRRPVTATSREIWLPLATALANLTVAEHQYTNTEWVLDAIVSLLTAADGAPSSSAMTLYIKALQNLSRWRADQIVRTGVLRHLALVTLSRHAREHGVMRALVALFYALAMNITSVSYARIGDDHGFKVLNAVAALHHPVDMRVTACLTLLEMCQHDVCQSFIVQEGVPATLVEAVCGAGAAEGDLLLLSAGIFVRLASRAANHGDLIRQGVVQAIGVFTRTTPGSVLHLHGLALIASLLPVMGDDGISSVIGILVENSRPGANVTESLCALGMFNVSCFPFHRHEAVSRGVLGALRAIATENDNPNATALCMAALWRFCGDDETQQAVLALPGRKPGSASWVIDLLDLLLVDELRADVAAVMALLVQQAAFPFSDEAVSLLLKAVRSLARTLSSESCSRAAVLLYAMSGVELTRRCLVHVDAVLSMADLIDFNNTAVVQCTISALVNLSDEPEIGHLLVRDGIARRLLALMSSMPVEFVRQGCSVVLGNIARSSRAVAKSLVNMQGVAALVVVGTLSCNSDATRRRVAFALCNVLQQVYEDAPTLRKAITDGIIWAVVKLGQMRDADVQRACSAALCNLTVSPTARAATAQEATQGLIDLAQASLQHDVQLVCVRALSNLLAARDSCPTMPSLVESGVVTHLHEMLQTVRPQLLLDVLQPLAMATEPSVHEEDWRDCVALIARGGVLDQVCDLVHRVRHLPLRNEERADLCRVSAFILCNVTWREEPETRAAVAERVDSVLSVLAALSAGGDESLPRLAAHALHNMSAAGDELRLLAENARERCEHMGAVLRNASVIPSALPLLVETAYNLTLTPDALVAPVVASLELMDLLGAWHQSEQLPPAARLEAAVGMCNLALARVNTSRLASSECPAVLRWMAAEAQGLPDDQQLLLSAALRRLLQPTGNVDACLAAGCARALVLLLDCPDIRDATLGNCIAALCKLSLRESSRERLVADGVVGAIVDRSQHIGDDGTRRQCLTTIANLVSAAQHNKGGITSALMSLSAATSSSQEEHCAAAPAAPVSFLDEVAPRSPRQALRVKRGFRFQHDLRLGQPLGEHRAPWITTATAIDAVLLRAESTVLLPEPPLDPQCPGEGTQDDLRGGVMKQLWRATKAQPRLYGKQEAMVQPAWNVTKSASRQELATSPSAPPRRTRNEILPTQASARNTLVLPTLAPTSPARGPGRAVKSAGGHGGARGGRSGRSERRPRPAKRPASSS